MRAFDVHGHMTSIGLKKCMPPYAILNKKLCVTETVAVEGATLKRERECVRGRERERRERGEERERKRKREKRKE
jgi:hypothetical protein